MSQTDSLLNHGCRGCDPVKKCLPCKHQFENGGQCGGCHVFYLDEIEQDRRIEWIKSLDPKEEIE